MKVKTAAKAGVATGRKTEVRGNVVKLNDPDSWDARLGFLMHDVSRLRRSVFDELMKPNGLTRSQWWILAHLSRHDGMIQSDLANVLDLGKAALGGLLDRLEASQLIERRPDDTDRRVKRIYLTNKGTQTIRDMRAKNHEMSERILEGLSVEARRGLAENLAVVKANLLSIRG
jgi:DNA-binding MarR family transcriptional regulator